MVCKGLGFLMLIGQFPKVAVDVVGIAALGFKLDGHMFDAELQGGRLIEATQGLCLCASQVGV